MLRNVCDRCNSVIDGEPVSKEYPEAMLLLDDEVAVMYENLCPECKSKLLMAVKMFGEREEQPKPKKTPTESDGNSEMKDCSRERNVVLPENVKVDVKEDALPLNRVTTDDAQEQARPLANQVVKQYPIKLPKHD